MSIEINTVYNENCLDTMSRMPDNFIDLVVTSPPYDGLREYDGERGIDFMFEFYIIARLIYYKMKPGGVVVWVASDQSINGSETLNCWRQLLYFVDSCGFNAHDTMVFEKLNYFPTRHNRYEQAWEPMFVLSKGPPKTFNPITIPCVEAGRVKKWTEDGLGAKESKQAKSARFRAGRVTVTRSEKYKSNVWKYSNGSHMSTDKRAHEHPAIFSEELAGDHIVSWSNPGDLVYDPFAGSGTTPYMAKKLSRNWIASEISKKYCKKLIKPRLAGLLPWGEK